jgi:hypothetical protein
MALGKCAEGSMRRVLKLAASVVRCRGSSEVSSTTSHGPPLLDCAMGEPRLVHRKSVADINFQLTAEH